VTIGIIDYGAGNLASVAKAFRAIGATPEFLREPRDLGGVNALVVPGVGHFRATRVLEPWRARVRGATDAGIPLLGICLGMQWLFEGSAEAPDVPGLGLFGGRCERLSGRTVKVPHVGWNTLDRTATASRLLADLPDGTCGYFTHTFAAPVTAATVATSTHGDLFAAAIERDLVFGTQFHPEKSGRAGLRMLEAFVTVARAAQARC
jgi:glutamine amidotransferase